MTNLLEYLYGALTPSNQRWLAKHLMEHAYEEEGKALAPYTMEELNARLDQSERDFAEGNCYTHEDVLKMLDEQLELASVEEHQYAEAV